MVGTVPLQDSPLFGSSRLHWANWPSTDNTRTDSPFCKVNDEFLSTSSLARANKDLDRRVRDLVVKREEGGLHNGIFDGGLLRTFSNKYVDGDILTGEIDL